MKSNFTFIIILFGLFLNAQTPKISGSIFFPPPKYTADTLEKSVLNVYYDTSFVKNTKNSNKKTNTIIALNIGKNYTQFLEVKQQKTDSLDALYSKKNKQITAKEFNEFFAVAPQWKYFVLKNRIKNNVLLQGRIKQTFQYEEEIPTIEWKTTTEKKEILGYQCTKATTKFRGRNYTAWYTTDIPFSEGPYLLGNLPGLILELYDDKNHYSFTAIAVDTQPKDIYLKTNDIIITSREKFRTAEKSYHQNPSFSTPEAYNKDGSTIRLKERPYNPIELK
ncbi:GLPGLI family protein [Bergeyella zoohelcum]|uniref:GLPGLI family protein n=1 Tax=Bergeyella zoohelcum ATCC 43767 TaxID=883096 RepID=K1LM15_9FLAO|nr:GLPGLI family protein [Bergeyella zoohelcum]EKB57835.1 hypothetical protein HMPREF9699_00820 [Bergeyella zoohelcum ATCC 43767]SUV48995.1 GLPGLI family protein [Bergeyella zoohelcum]